MSDNRPDSTSSAIYGLGLIGAAVYFISNAPDSGTVSSAF